LLLRFFPEDRSSGLRLNHRVIRPLPQFVLLLSLPSLMVTSWGNALVPPGPVPAPTCQGQVATIVGTEGSDVITGTGGPDVIVAGAGHDVVRARDGADVVCAGPGADLIRGGWGADIIAGERGLDSLFGGLDDDLLAGGEGQDGCLQGDGIGSKISCAVRIAAAGDIGCDPGDAGWNRGRGTARECRMRTTSNLVVRRGFVAVLPLGDIQYEDGALWKIRRSYGPTWGRAKDISHPVVGNHDYHTPGARGYFEYFGSAAGRRGYYAVDLDEWHMVVLNAVCFAAGGCDGSSPQLRWLKEDLAADTSACTLAAWHAPRFSSGLHGNDRSSEPFWRALYADGAEVVLNGHDHHYERFAPQDPDRRLRRVRGIREFVVGTGGHSLYPLKRIRPNSAVRMPYRFGVLVLTLHPDRYEWQFVGQGGQTLDSGSTACH
jgi:Ca2+-binding RTX toxin-like protein